MKIAMLQMNPTVGDFTGNAATIIAAAEAAKAAGAGLLVTSEMALTGYPVADLLFREAFFPQLALALEEIRAVRGITLVVGYPDKVGEQYFNTAGVFRDGAQVAAYHKNTLSNNSVFDERRYFTAGNQACIFTHGQSCFGLLMGDDLRHPEAVARVRSAGAETLLVLNASPFYAGKQAERVAVAQAAQTGLPLLAVNAAGGQDELVFDGLSFALDGDGTQAVQAGFCTHESLMVDFNPQQKTFAQSLTALPGTEAQLYQAVLTGLRDYVQKCGFTRLCLGLSGGLDSALVLALAVDAVGAENCEVLLMPSQYTAQLSNTAAVKMARTLGVRYESVPISGIFNTFKQSLEHRFTGLAEDVTEENLQARIRGTLLMALSNKSGALLLSTGNKSEVAMGYATLYGDMNGGYAPLKDLFKTQCYAISRWLNAVRGTEVIPQEIIDRPPSAELRANQTDQDSLPEYAVLDEMLTQIMEENASAADLTAQGFEVADVRRTFRLLRLSEYKRRQGALGPKVSRCAFGTDWRQPVCQRFEHD